MAARRVVVSGASIAGLSAAWWLSRTGWRVTVLERAAGFRDGGQNVDVRGVAHTVLDRMGLTEAVAAQNTTETGTVLVGPDGREVAELPSEGPDGATAELEVLRGDFARVLLDALPDDVEVRYDQTIDAVDERADGIALRLASGEELEADLLVVAEGVRSRTRDRLFGAQVERRGLGVAMVFGTIPRTPDDDDRWRWLTADRGRRVHLRPDNHGTTRAMLCLATADDLAALDRGAALERLRAAFGDAGWQAPRVLDGFATSDDVYVDQLTQIRMPTWHRGRVCLVGDAAWCVTPMGGGGSSLALTGGYVLAASLSGGDGSGPGIEAGLAAYEAWMRPLVDDVQGIPRGVVRLAFPRSALALRARNLVLAGILRSPLSRVVGRLFSVADDPRPLPELHATVA
ncbi:FAD-dependent monooxygenase [Microlunatus flavus]|uniref:2-polyprenyl-6-methoxyphenol hydroxylase n=1 Tax=Microlunatus flavus TaxID=1036181 RepID=A0A1H9I4J0_9ACTN|nr:FAD-dependent monooxygenase [Microlunatus flavus]SEQ69504.1 2-polyprenyl-6-methoxyphenol hydroxylase [Microlunatus flavus]